MALFSLLVAIMVERLSLMPKVWQPDVLLVQYEKLFFGRKQLSSDVMMAIALLLPALAVQVLAWFVAGQFWGLWSLALWLGIAMLCFSHQKKRYIFKQYIQAACRGDVQACYQYAQSLDAYSSVEAYSEKELGIKVGQIVSWLNYRFYAAVSLYFIFLGPAGAVFYCTVRHFSDESKAKQISLPLAEKLLVILDWLPSRLIALGYVFSGRFSEAFSVWRQLALDWQASAQHIIAEVALAAEPVETKSDAPICVQATIALLDLSKRNFRLLVTGLALLTIFGVVA